MRVLAGATTSGGDGMEMLIVASVLRILQDRGFDLDEIPRLQGGGATPRGCAAARCRNGCQSGVDSGIHPGRGLRTSSDVLIYNRRAARGMRGSRPLPKGCARAQDHYCWPGPRIRPVSAAPAVARPRPNE